MEFQKVSSVLKTLLVIFFHMFLFFLNYLVKEISLHDGLFTVYEPLELES